MNGKFNENEWNVENCMIEIYAINSMNENFKKQNEEKNSKVEKVVLKKFNEWKVQYSK